MRGLEDVSPSNEPVSEKDIAMKMLEISGKIQEIAEEQFIGSGMPNSDYQGAIEAQVLIAIQYGLSLGKGKAI